jgi:hypothetical protein
MRGYRGAKGTLPAILAESVKRHEKSRAHGLLSDGEAHETACSGIGEGEREACLRDGDERVETSDGG